MNTEITTIDNQERIFALEQRRAQAMISGSILPAHFKNVGDIIILGEMGKSLNIPVVMLAQQLYIVKGKPSMSGQLVIALLNASGRFDKPIKFEERKDVWGVRAVGLMDKEEYCGEWIDDALIRANNWASNPHWKNNKGLMARYRAASWFGRLYAPDVLMGFMTEGETVDAEIERYIAPSLQKKKKPRRRRRRNAEIEASRIKEQKTLDEKDEIITDVVHDDVNTQPKMLRSYFYGLLSKGLKNSDLSRFVEHYKLDNNNAEEYLENESDLEKLVEDFNNGLD